jgi:hypothetical protein
MDLKEFIVEMTKALAWPTTLLITVAIIQKHITGLLPRLEKIKHKDTELEFAMVVSKVQERAEDLLLNREIIDNVIIGEFKRLDSIIDIAPKSVICQAFAIVDKYYFELVSFGTAKEKRGKQLVYEESHQILNGLGISNDILNQYHDLRRIRNITLAHRLIHLNESELEDYMSMAKHLSNVFQERVSSP